MKLMEALFKKPEILIFRVLRDDDWRCGEFDAWHVEAVTAPTLSREFLAGVALDGPFILQGRLITATNSSDLCYLGVSMPEAIVSGTFIKEGDQICQKKGRLRVHKEAILAVAIEKLVDYNLYYSRRDVEVGLATLGNALTVAQTRWPIAHAMSCIFRDEGRYHESIDALGIVIAEGPRDLRYSNFQERALLWDRLGNAEAAERDRATALEILNAP